MFMHMNQNSVSNKKYNCNTIFSNVLMKLFTEKCSDQKLNDILNKIQRKNEVQFSVFECKIWKKHDH